MATKTYSSIYERNLIKTLQPFHQQQVQNRPVIDDHFPADLELIILETAQQWKKRVCFDGYNIYKEPVSQRTVGGIMVNVREQNII